MNNVQIVLVFMAFQSVLFLNLGQTYTKINMSKKYMYITNDKFYCTVQLLLTFNKATSKKTISSAVGICNKNTAISNVQMHELFNIIQWQLGSTHINIKTHFYTL